MKRNLFTTIEEFITNKDLYTYILSGAPFVGKTYLCIDLFKSYSTDYLYIDVRSDNNFNKFINNNADKIKKLSDLLALYFNIPQNTLLKLPVILDEITENDKLFNMILDYGNNQEECLKMFLIISKKKDALLNAFTNKKYKHSILNPFSFDEFLVATGHEWYRDLIEGHFSNSKKLPEMLHNEILSLFDIYMNVGGMPSAILEYLNYESLINVHNINNNLFTLTKARYNDVKINNILNTIKECLKIKSKKFTFTKIHKGATIQQYKQEIDTLVEDNILTKSTKLLIDNSKVEEDAKAFRLYFNNFTYIPIEDNGSMENRLFSYINTNICCTYKNTYYIETKGGSLTDFIYFDKKSNLVPLYVKSGTSSREKAIEALQEVLTTKYTYTVYQGNYDSSRKNCFIPFYSIFAVDKN